MKYNILKDSRPKDTILRISKILEKHNINIKIENTCCGKNYYSCRVFLENFLLGTNGKGTCEENSLASGLAEFIERLQAQFLFEFEGDFYIGFPDSEICLLKNINFDFGIKIKFLNDFFHLNPKSSLFKKTTSKLENRETILAPFISYKNKKPVNLPILLVTRDQCTNGFAAGNTHEEACTQALSEIIERYCAKEIYTKTIHMPEIPKKYYAQYEKLTNLKKEIENLGYKITIKDASLGKNFPTICCVFEDLKYPKNGVCVKFGTHPYFPIALERCLTEFMQGHETIEEQRLDNIKFFSFSNGTKLEKIFHETTLRKSFIKSNNICISHILSKKSDWKFNKNVWYFNEKKNNKFLFNKLCKLLLKYNKDIYIRNHNFLGFPTVQIYIPEFSNPLISNPEIKKNWLNVYSWMNYIEKDVPPNDFSIDSLLKACIFLCEYTPQSIEIIYNFGPIQARYLGFYCSILENNKKLIRKFLKLILNEQATLNDLRKNETLKYYQAFKKYFKLHFAFVDKEKIKEIIEKKYSKEIYIKIENTLNNINNTSDIIFKIIKEKPLRSTCEKNPKIEQIKKNLHKIYYQKPPNQNEILKIIEKPNFFKRLFIS